ncbi:MAG: ATP-binding cassette domain-containing protein [Saprospiraceae bacterium]
MIQLKNLSKSYGNKEVLKDINLEFARGQVYGIVGANGAGKTTLFKCVAGLEDHYGKVESDQSPLKNHLGFLSTDPYFFSKITGREYLQLLCNARGIQGKNFLTTNIFNLPLEEYAANYSTGMKKKLALSAILLLENDYYILDEPFNGVDIQSNMIITEIIHRLKTLNKVVLISSHIFSTLNKTCDRIYLLKDGEIDRTVDKNDFDALEQEMIDFTIGDSINQLGLS